MKLILCLALFSVFAVSATEVPAPLSVSKKEHDLFSVAKKLEEARRREQAQRIALINVADEANR